MKKQLLGSVGVFGFFLFAFLKIFVVLKVVMVAQGNTGSILLVLLLVAQKKG